MDAPIPPAAAAAAEPPRPFARRREGPDGDGLAFEGRSSEPAVRRVAAREGWSLRPAGRALEAWDGAVLVGRWDARSWKGATRDPFPVHAVPKGTYLIEARGQPDAAGLRDLRVRWATKAAGVVETARVHADPHAFARRLAFPGNVVRVLGLDGRVLPAPDAEASGRP